MTFIVMMSIANILLFLINVYLEYRTQRQLREAQEVVVRACAVRADAYDLRDKAKAAEKAALVSLSEAKQLRDESVAMLALAHNRLGIAPPDKPAEETNAH